MLDDSDADAVEARILVLFEFLELAVREVSGMRIERREHSLNRSLRGFFVIDVAGIVAGDGGDGFVVVFFDLVDDAVRVLCVGGSETAETMPAANHPSEYSSRQDQDGGAKREPLVDPELV